MSAMDRIRELDERFKENLPIKDPIQLRYPVSFDDAHFLLKSFKVMREIAIVMGMDDRFHNQEPGKGVDSWFEEVMKAQE